MPVPGATIAMTRRPPTRVTPTRRGPSTWLGSGPEAPRLAGNSESLAQTLSKFGAGGPEAAWVIGVCCLASLSEEPRTRILVVRHGSNCHRRVGLDSGIDGFSAPPLCNKNYGWNWCFLGRRKLFGKKRKIFEKIREFAPFN